LIVLEDLRDKNFQLADRLAGLDIPHMRLALNGLAKIHAASMVLLKRDKKLFEDFEIGFYNRKTRAFDAMFEKNLEVFTEEVATWTEWNESAYYSRKLKDYQKVLMENGCRAFDLNELDTNAFTHGDLWTTNLLFTYDQNGDPEETVVLDYQYSFVGSVTLDLHYFLFTSLPDDIRESKMDELIQFYYYELKSFLQKLNYDMSNFPTLHGLQIEFLRKMFYGEFGKYFSF
jgi:thiamine kinase-like enzyme